MDMDLRRIFGEPALDLLAKHGFAERRRHDGNGLARDYANRDFGIQLTYSVQGKNMFLMPRNDLRNYYSVEYVVGFFSGDEAHADKSFDAAVRFVGERYSTIAALFSGRDGGAGLKELDDFIYRQNARRFHYDRIADPS